MPTREITAPTSCDRCLFHQTFQVPLEDCRLYPGMRKPVRRYGAKYDFCKLEKIVIHERD
jgi:hypothetical protein